MTRPKLSLRARGAMMALGALCFATALAVPSGSAHSKPSSPIKLRHAALNVVAGHRASVSGAVAAAPAGQRVSLQRRSGHSWQTIKRASTRAGGAFTVRFRPDRIGSAKVRLASGSARRGLGRLNVYRHAMVSWYGPGLYGNSLSCGGRLEPGTLGVAHKTLPCGAHVTLRRGHRVVRVTVVDRGPYVAGREFDLTAATRARLHFGGVGSVLVAS
jgi:rare lipoprotein A (peptidoglycan hydrolase)